MNELGTDNNHTLIKFSPYMHAMPSYIVLTILKELSIIQLPKQSQI